jgi:acyl dehydratase
MKGYFEDFEVGARFDTRTRLITSEDHDAFCSLVGYEVPLFRDDAYANVRGLPGRLCPSHLVMSFSTAMTGDLFAETVLAMLALGNARFIVPVHPGDTIRTVVEVLNKRPASKQDRGIVVFRDHVYNQRGEEVFCNDKTVMLKRRAYDSR